MKSLRTIAASAVLALALLLSAAAPAAAQTSSSSIPLNMGVFIPCANGGEGEFVELTGTLHILFHASTNAQGCTTVKVHFQPQGLSGVGATTGAKYQGVGVTQSTTVSRTSCDGCTVEFENSVNNFRMIGQGPGNNFQVHTNTRIIYNFCTNEATVVSSNESVKCF